MQPMIEAGWGMEGFVRARESDVIKTLGSGSIISQLQITAIKWHYATRKYFLCSIANKAHVNISLLVTPKDSVTTIQVHPAFDPTAKRRQWIDAIMAVMNPVTLTINTYRLESLNIRTRYKQTSVIINTERLQTRQRWQNG